MRLGSLVPFTQHAADRSCGKKMCTQRLVRREGISNCEDTIFSTITMRFRPLLFFRKPVKLPCCRMGLPSRYQNVESLNKGQSVFNVFSRAVQVLLGHRDSRLQRCGKRL